MEGALKEALRSQVKESRPTIDSDIARDFAAFCKRVENPVQADLRAYLECLRLSLTIPNEQVWKGVAAHFEAYAKVFHSVSPTKRAWSPPWRPFLDKLKAYMALCRKEDQVHVAVNNTTTSIRLGIGQAPSTSSSVQRILQCSTGQPPSYPRHGPPSGSSPPHCARLNLRGSMEAREAVEQHVGVRERFLLDVRRLHNSIVVAQVP